MGRLDGKVAIITGTAGGQGRAAAVLFAAEGAKVVGCDVEAGVSHVALPGVGGEGEFDKWLEKSPENTVRMVRSKGGEMVSLHPCDLTSAKEAERLVEFALDSFGRVDVLYNNAARGEFGWFDEITHDEFWSCMRGELDTVFLPTKAVWPVMARGEGGSIINTSSISATKVYEVFGAIGHMTVKAAVQAFTRHLAFEGASRGIRVNCISPGLIVSPSAGPFMKDERWREGFVQKQMIKRFGTPMDIARAAVFLGSDESSWITGVNIPVDGGSSGM